MGLLTWALGAGAGCGVACLMEMFSADAEFCAAEIIMQPVPLGNK